MTNLKEFLGGESNGKELDESERQDYVKKLLEILKNQKKTKIQTMT